MPNAAKLIRVGLSPEQANHLDIILDGVDNGTADSRTPTDTTRTTLLGTVSLTGLVATDIIVAQAVISMGAAVGAIVYMNLSVGASIAGTQHYAGKSNNGKYEPVALVATFTGFTGDQTVAIGWSQGEGAPYFAMSSRRRTLQVTVYKRHDGS